MNFCKIPFWLLLFILFIPAYVSGSPNKPLFFMTYSIKGDSLGKVKATALTSPFFGFLGKELKKEYPCIENSSINDAKVFVGYSLRQDLMGGQAEGEGLKNLAESMSSDYLIVLNIICFYNSGTLSLSATCIDVTSGLKMSMAGSVTTISGNWENEMENIAQKLVYGLKDYEICPYKGSLNIQIQTDTTVKTINETDVYCRKLDRKYTKTITHEKKSSADWQLEKTGKYNGSGTILYTMAEKHSIEENNECFNCEPMITGYRNYSDITVNYIEIQGLSERNKKEADYVKYATIRIKFKEDSTYTITVDAASQTAELKTIHEEKASGDCQTFIKPQELRSNKSSIPLRKILGPYKGNSLNKVLQEEQTLELIDPLTKERTTLKINFNLKRN